MTPTPTRPILKFRPGATWARTILYEYYCMSWATRIAAEGTTHPPLAARLVGESFELAVKVLHILSQGPERKLKFGHSLGGVIRHMQPLERLLRNLWGGDLDYVIDILEGECNPSQVRYGAGGGKSNKRSRIIPSGYAETSGVWTSTTLTLYEELMSSLGQAIWSNYPKGDRNGNPVGRRLKMIPGKVGPEGPRRFSAEEEAALQKEMMDPTIWAWILTAVNTDPAAPVVPYWGIIPLQRLNDPGRDEFIRAGARQRQYGRRRAGDQDERWFQCRLMSDRRPRDRPLPARDPFRSCDIAGPRRAGIADFPARLPSRAGPRTLEQHRPWCPGACDRRYPR